MGEGAGVGVGVGGGDGDSVGGGVGAEATPLLPLPPQAASIMVTATTNAAECRDKRMVIVPLLMY